mgnify:CR=1 FL=1
MSVVKERVCAQKEIVLAHISTDYVFDGSGETPWQPDAPLDQLDRAEQVDLLDCVGRVLAADIVKHSMVFKLEEERQFRL